MTNKNPKTVAKTFIALVDVGSKVSTITIPTSVALGLFGLNPKNPDKIPPNLKLYGISQGEFLQLNVRKPDLCIPPLALTPESFVPLDKTTEKYAPED